MTLDDYACQNCGAFSLEVAYDPGCTFIRCSRCGNESSAVPDYDPDAAIEKFVNTINDHDGIQSKKPQ